MSQYRAPESFRAESTPEVSPMRLSTADQFGAVDTSVLAAANSSATDALVRGGTLPGLSLSESAAATSSDVTAAAAAPSNDRLAARADGSLDAHVKAGDNLWRIAREALSQGHEDGYRPSDRDVMAAVGAIARDNQMQNPNLIHAGDVIHIPAELLQQRQAQDQSQRPAQDQAQDQAQNQAQDQAQDQAQSGDHPQYRMHGEVYNATHAFGNSVVREFERLPQNVRRLLAESGNKLVVAGRSAEFDSTLEGTDATKLNGYYDPAKHAIVMAEKHYDPSRGYVPNDDVSGTFGLSAAHAVDSALGNFSHTDEFKRALEADAASMSETARTRFAGLLQDGDAGREATFAQIFTTIGGSATSNDQTLSILRDFSHVKALMQARLGELPS